MVLFFLTIAFNYSVSVFPAASVSSVADPAAMPAALESSVPDPAAMTARIEANKQAALKKRAKVVTDLLEVCATSAMMGIVNSEECKDNILLALRKDLDWDVLTTWAQELDERFTGQDNYNILEEALIAVFDKRRKDMAAATAQKRGPPSTKSDSDSDCPLVSASVKRSRPSEVALGEVLGTFVTTTGSKITARTCALEEGSKASQGGMDITCMNRVERRLLRNSSGFMGYRMCLGRDFTTEDLKSFMTLNNLDSTSPWILMSKCSECWLCCRRNCITASGRYVKPLEGSEGTYYSFDGTMSKIVQQIHVFWQGCADHVGTMKFDSTPDQIVAFRDAAESVKDLNPEEWLDLKANCKMMVKKKKASALEDAINIYKEELATYLETIWSAVGCVKKVSLEDLRNSSEVEWHKLPKEMKETKGMYWCEVEKTIKVITIAVVWIHIDLNGI
jgi:hypothetical protein